MSKIYLRQKLTNMKNMSLKHILFSGFVFASLFISACGSDLDPQKKDEPTSSGKSNLVSVKDGTGVGTCTTTPNSVVSYSGTVPSGITGLTDAWNFNIGGSIWSPPIVSNNRIFVTNNVNSVVALNMNGEKLWEFKTPETIWGLTLVVGSKIVYISSLGGHLYALDVSDCTQLWTKDLGIDNVLKPLLFEDKLYIPTTYVWGGLPTPSDIETKFARLFVLNATTGTPEWEFESGNYILSRPVIDNGVIYQSGNWKGPPVEEGGNQRLYALDKASCEAGACDTNWIYESEDGFTRSLVINNGILSYLGYRDWIRGLDITTGNVLWSYQTQNWAQQHIAFNDFLVFGSANNAVHFVNNITGAKSYKYIIPGAYMNYIVGSSFFVGSTMYNVSVIQRNIFAVDTTTLALLWSHDTVSVADNTSGKARTGVQGSWSPVVVDDMVFLGSVDGYLYAYKMK